MRDDKFLVQISEKIRLKDNKEKSKWYAETFINLNKMKIAIPKINIPKQEIQKEFRNLIIKKNDLYITELDDFNDKVINDRKINNKNIKYITFSKNSMNNYMFLINDETTISKLLIAEKVIIKIISNFDNIKTQFDWIVSKVKSYLNIIPQMSSNIIINDWNSLNLTNFDFNKSRINFKSLDNKYENDLIKNSSFKLINLDDLQFDKYKMTLNKFKKYLKLDEKILRFNENIQFLNKRSERRNYLYDFFDYFNTQEKENDLTRNFFRFKDILYILSPKFKSTCIEEKNKNITNFPLNFIYNDSLFNINLTNSKTFYKSRNLNNFKKNTHVSILDEINYNESKYFYLGLNEIYYNKIKKDEFKKIESKEIKNSSPEVSDICSIKTKIGSKRKYSQLEGAYNENNYKNTVLINSNKLHANFSENWLTEVTKILNYKKVNFILVENKFDSSLLKGLDIVLNLNTACILLNSGDFLDELDSECFNQLYEIIKKNYLNYETIFIIVFQFHLDDQYENISKVMQTIFSVINRNFEVLRNNNLNSTFEIKISKINKATEIADFICNSNFNLIDTRNFHKYSQKFKINSNIISTNFYLLSALNIYELNILSNIEYENEFDIFIQLLSQKYKNKINLNLDFIKNIIYRENKL